MDRSMWEWQQTAGKLHAAPISGPYRHVPGDEVTFVCGESATLCAADFPRRPIGTRTCGACMAAVSAGIR
ncbi:MAG TPA: hypothetical protein VM677_09825 [Actinokineospora sp.]|jgi:hypothetical protein|nr:hypothetical protein [Actinokineospora sp.]